MLSKSIFKLFEKKVKKMSHGKNFIVQTLIHNILSRIILATEKKLCRKKLTCEKIDRKIMTTKKLQICFLETRKKQ